MDSFIEKVKLYPCLWDTSHVSYRDTAKKDLVWQHVARECGITSGKEAQCQWKKLRDSHREAMRRRKTSTAQNWRPWKYETEMGFLLLQNVKRPTFLNDTQDSTYDALNTTENPINNTIKESPPESPPLSEYSLPTEENMNHCVLHPTSSTESENSNQKRLVTESITDIFQERELRQIHKDELRRQVIDMHHCPQDALSKLFDSLCQKTRELPKYLQLRVEREIFEAVSRAEEEALSMGEHKF
ncbi:uncharacterized protein LOC113228699 [Hyposmocoma kahamanoa]|uniref:uncharacterized protein LOC113228699 n=1 Tax=Hyposmocoma kahamanoa TaxID=1477025 RepID=UPI000E6D79F7|nr:uncharacterized protein LOC113228699 [Hyposmocoma kahamanoa]